MEVNDEGKERKRKNPGQLTENQQIELLNRARVTVPADSDDVDGCSQDGRVLCEGSGGVFEGRDRR